MTNAQIKAKLDDLHEQYGGEDEVLHAIIKRLPAKLRAPGSVDTTCDLCEQPCCWVAHETIGMLEKHGREHIIKMCMPCMNVVMDPNAQHTVLHNHHSAKSLGVDPSVIRELEKRLAADCGADYQDPLRNN